MKRIILLLLLLVTGCSETPVTRQYLNQYCLDRIAPDIKDRCDCIAREMMIIYEREDAKAYPYYNSIAEMFLVVRDTSRCR